MLTADRLGLTARPRAKGVRGGLASRGVAPTVLSGAAAGHDRVRDGTGWGHRALGHGLPSPPDVWRLEQVTASVRFVVDVPVRCHTWGAPRPPDRAPAPPVVQEETASVGNGCLKSASRTSTQHTHSGVDRLARGTLPERNRPPLGRAVPPSAIGTARLRSVARRPPAAHRPPGLGGALPSCPGGGAGLGEGFPLRCCQRFARPDVATQRRRPPDDWPTIGPSTPVLSY